MIKMFRVNDCNKHKVLQIYWQGKLVWTGYYIDLLKYLNIDLSKTQLINCEKCGLLMEYPYKFCKRCGYFHEWKCDK